MKKKLTNQRLVNYVVKFMRKQGRPSFNTMINSCVNVDDDGNRCAIACCFTPASGRKFSNKLLINKLVEMGASLVVVTDLLHAHDRSVCSSVDFVEFFENNLRSRLNTHGYTYITIPAKD